MSDYPPELEQVVMRALSQRREERFQTAREFSRALQSFLMSQGTFVGPEDVGDYVKDLFTDRVRKREKYLEWAAEVTSAIDVEELRKQQAAAENQAPSLLHETPASNGGMGSVPSASHVKERQAPHRSFGQDSAAAAVVASVPHQAELASSSLMDEDEDIPTVVAQPREPEPSRPGIRPAAGAPATAPTAQPPPRPSPVWNGMRTQVVEDESLDATIALPDQQAADQIRARVTEMEQRQLHQQQQHPGYPPQYAYGAPQQPAAPQYPAQTSAMQQHYGQHANPALSPFHGSPAPPPVDPYGYTDNAQQGAVETKMSLPRPAAVAQWLMEQGDVEIQGPRSTGVIIAIAALATLCVMGVASLIVYKLRAPLPTPVVAAPVTGPVAPASEGEDESDPEAAELPVEEGETAKTAEEENGSPTKPGGEPTQAKSTGPAPPTGKTAPEEAGDPPGMLSINSNPPCDSVVAAGKSLGACPAYNVPMPPGMHRVTLKRGSDTKTIMVRVISGQLTSHTVPLR
jgi:serine/threonine-protein kinase